MKQAKMDTTDKSKYAHQTTLAAICLVLVLVGCQSDTPPATVEANVLSASELYPSALKIAKEWKVDAYLIHIHAIAEPGNRPASFVTYLFYSPSTPYIALHLNYDAASRSFAEDLFPASKLDPEETLEIWAHDWTVDSTEALEIAQAHGGGEFLAKWDASPSLALEKQVSGGEIVTVWDVSYFEVVTFTYREKTFAILDLKICATTGEVLAVRTE